MAPISMAYDKYEPEEKTSNLYPIILCHGILMSKVMFREVCIRLCNETGREVFCVDLRGHGDSPRCDEISCGLMAEDLKYFFQEHEIKKASIIAFSISNSASLDFAENNTHLVEKFISVEPPLLNTKDEELGMSIMKTSASGVLAFIKYLDPKCTEDEGRAKFTQMLIRNPMLNITKPVAALYTLDLIKSDKGFQFKSDVDCVMKWVIDGKFKLPAISYEGKTLCIFGELSGVSSETRRNVDKFFPNSKSVVIKGGSHQVIFEKTEEFVDEVKRFLQEKV